MVLGKLNNKNQSKMNRFKYETDTINIKEKIKENTWRHSTKKLPQSKKKK